MNSTEDFILEYSQQLFEQIFEVIYGDAKYDFIKLHERKYTDRINSYGTVVLWEGTEKEICVQFEDGNFNGSVIVDYGDVGYLEKPQYRTIFVVDEDAVKQIARQKGIDPEKHLKYIKRLWSFNKTKHDEVARKYAYDSFFEPTNKTKKYYQEYLKKHLLRVECVEVNLTARKRG